MDKTTKNKEKGGWRVETLEKVNYMKCPYIEQSKATSTCSGAHSTPMTTADPVITRMHWSHAKSSNTTLRHGTMLVTY